jgi:hypothetical protein
MPAKLVIRDGQPQWWNSASIWVVPGEDPNGTPGSPVAGQPAYLWARVENQGDQGASGARVEFYWSNPATGVLRSNSTLVGSSFVDLAAGDVKDVLCIVPWIPVVVNDGHECVVAQVIHPADPLPSPLPDAFDPPSNHQVAQKNLTVLQVAQSMLVMPIQIVAPQRQAKLLRLRLEVGGELDRENLAQLRLDGFRPGPQPQVAAQLALDSGCDANGREGERELELKLGPGAARAVYLKVAPRRLAPRSYTLVHVIASEDERVFGGITYIAVSSEEPQGKG